MNEVWLFCFVDQFASTLPGKSTNSCARECTDEHTAVRRCSISHARVGILKVNGKLCADSDSDKHSDSGSDFGHAVARPLRFQRDSLNIALRHTVLNVVLYNDQTSTSETEESSYRRIAPATLELDQYLGTRFQAI